MADQPPPATPPPAPSGPDGEDLDPRPLPLRAIAVLGLIFGFLGVLTVPWGVMSVYRGAFPEEGTINAAVAWLLVFTIAGSALSVLLLIGSFGALRLRAWARPVMIAYGVGSVLLGVVSLIFNLPMYLRVFGDGEPPVRGVGPCCALVSWPVGTVYGIAVLVVMFQPAVRAAFRRDLITPPPE